MNAETSFHCIEFSVILFYTVSMKLTAKVKLLTTPDQHAYLLQTLERANAACDYISQQAWDTKTFGQFKLHELTYATVRVNFDLTAQVVIRCISKVTDAYKLDKRTQRTFKPHGGIAYDSRILNWRIPTQTVSIWSIAGRLSVPFAAGERQLELLQHQQGETDLVYIKGTFYLFAVCNVEEAKPIDVEGVLGVDLGIANIAVDSDGTFHSGSHVKRVRYRHRRLRTKLQKKGTKAAKRLLKFLSGKETRFANDVNHCISKQLVKTAQGTHRAIALEDLGGIRDRVTVGRRQRTVLHSWSFHDLQQKIGYKAKRRGVPMIFVDPRNTSRTCPQCGCIDKHNRRSQSAFACIGCGFAAHADLVAAGNISSRGAVNHPHVASRPEMSG
jgi:putative transposase